MVREGNIKIKLLDSLKKLFPDGEPGNQEWKRGQCFRNEAYSFQVAYYWSGNRPDVCNIRAISGLGGNIGMRSVELVPSELPCFGEYDDNMLRYAPGLFPDLLLPADSCEIKLMPRQWRSVWVTVEGDESLAAGVYPIDIVLEDGSCNEICRTTFTLEILDGLLPKQSILHTEWFHADCLATWYKAEVFSEEHWKLIAIYMDTLVKHSVNMILTPVFTPPLDTRVGDERLTVQLVEVTKTQDSYTFGYERLERWIALSRSKGIEYFEFTHLFTQWGSRHAPKIMARVNGEDKRIFGWDTRAEGEEYHNFLKQFLPSLVSFIQSKGLEKNVYFHISDEPSPANMENYKYASALVRKYIGDLPVIDALSDIRFFESGIIKTPVATTNTIHSFIERNVPELWAYYCLNQYKLVSNRHFNMPSARNRIIGIQLYKFGIRGFLHWGYNYWYSKDSVFPVDPFRVSDNGRDYQSGESYLVYPGQEGPLESIRLEVLREAFQDYRALSLLESLAGKEEVVRILEEGLENPITFRQYPREDAWLLSRREHINFEIMKRINTGK